MTKKILALLISVLFTSTAIAEEKKAKLITVNQFVRHPALDNVLEGLEQGLQEHGLIIGKDIELIKDNAQGNIATAVQVSQHQASLKPDVMVAIATPSAQSSLKARRDENTILAFAAVTDPKAAGLVGKANVIGVTDNPPLTELLELVLQTLPRVKRIGVLYNPSEINSVNTIKLLAEFAAKRGLEVNYATLNSSNDIILAGKSLIGKVDLIYLPQDNTVVSGIEAISKIASSNHIPLISNDPALVDKGVFMALGCNYKAIGKQLASMINEEFQHQEKKVSRISDASIKELSINEETADSLNIKIPHYVLTKKGAR